MTVEADLTKDTPDELQSKVFDFLRFPLAVAVVFIHCFGEPLRNCYNLSSGGGLY